MSGDKFKISKHPTNWGHKPQRKIIMLPLPLPLPLSLPLSLAARQLEVLLGRYPAGEVNSQLCTLIGLSVIPS